ncbi:MAG: hypothetical protein RR365_15505, partial [Bacteroides sp.]
FANPIVKECRGIILEEQTFTMGVYIAASRRGSINMKRLTERTKAGTPNLKVECEKSKDQIYLSARRQLAIDRLADYEDIGTVEELTALAKARDEGRVVVLPCKVGDTVYGIAPCGEIWMCFDDDYDTGTGATECPFENTCDIEECDDNHIRIFETKCSGFGFEENGRILIFFGGLTAKNNDTCWGKTIFLTRAEAEAALKGRTDG